MFSRENANWEIFTNRSYVNALLLSDDKATLWVGTTGGLEEMDALNGRLIRVYTKQSGLSDNTVTSLISYGQCGIWVETAGGLGHLTYSSGKINDEQYLTGRRAAIIIAGGGNTDENVIWDSTEKISNYSYKMLNKRGFSNTDIQYPV